MKKIIVIFMLILSSLSLSAKKLYVGTNAEFKPYEYLEGDKIVGFDIDLMNKLGEKLGYEIKWVDMNFDGLLTSLQLKKIDAVIAGMSATEERKKAASFSIPYLFFKSGHLVLVNENSNFSSKQELKDKTVGVQIGSIQEGFAKDIGAIPKLYSSFTAALMDLQNQKVDSVIVAENTGVEYLKTMNKIKKIDMIDDSKPGASIAFRKADKELAEEFSKAILEIKESDFYAELIKKYFPDKYDNFIMEKNKK
ncbi:MAG: transporter substrate-binding domain-containing protein [Fusobacterium sp.]|uniref:transporter substrate-binding domain-containing protein n=1 Tax=Fusobacterium sp. TaxID=68766 RepID=UPI0026DADFDB|nr:transporter substrate-binding domain-containing protein [Fusobacterium sp.]MDO4690614.1 transporter substrate-binding domain-containing protein [Fusobacterium sp.]